MAREIVERIGDELGQAHVANLEARVRTFERDFVAAADLLRRSGDIFANRPDDWGEVMHRIVTAWLEFAQGRVTEARSLLTVGIEEVSAAGFQEGVRSLRRELKLIDQHSGYPA